MEKYREDGEGEGEEGNILGWGGGGVESWVRWSDIIHQTCKLLRVWTVNIGRINEDRV
jgi:hypothetical protein